MANYVNFCDKFPISGIWNEYFALLQTSHGSVNYSQLQYHLFKSAIILNYYKLLGVISLWSDVYICLRIVGRSGPGFRKLVVMFSYITYVAGVSKRVIALQIL